MSSVQELEIFQLTVAEFRVRPRMRLVPLSLSLLAVLILHNLGYGTPSRVTHNPLKSPHAAKTRVISMSRYLFSKEDLEAARHLLVSQELLLLQLVVVHKVDDHSSSFRLTSDSCQSRELITLFSYMELMLVTFLCSYKMKMSLALELLHLHRLL